MAVRTRREWRGNVRANLSQVLNSGTRLLARDAALNAEGHPLFSYTERQMILAVQPIIEAKLASVVQVL